jgi:hypothetical protein
VQIGCVPDPRNWDRWPEVEAYLEPARARGGFPSVLDDDEVLFVVLDGGELLAAATAWLSTDRFVELKLLGGRDHKRWIRELDEHVGREARIAGATELRAWGRRGWAKQLGAMGWATLPYDSESNGYSRGISAEKD